MFSEKLSELSDSALPRLARPAQLAPRAVPAGPMCPEYRRNLSCIDQFVHWSALLEDRLNGTWLQKHDNTVTVWWCDGAVQERSNCGAIEEAKAAKKIRAEKSGR